MFDDCTFAPLETRLSLLVDLSRDEVSDYFCLTNAYRSENQFIQTTFNEHFTYDQFIHHMVFLLYKDHYIDSSKRKSFRDWERTLWIKKQPNEDPDVYRRKMNRSLNIMLAQKRHDIERLGICGDYIDLVARKTKMEHDRANTYHLTDLDVAATESYNSDGLKLIDLLKKGTMAYSKGGISGADIAEAYHQYWEQIQKDGAQSDSGKWVQSLINLSNIETWCLPYILYAIAKYMDTHKLEYIPPCLSIICSKVDFTSDSAMISRFLCERSRNIHRFFNSEDAQAAVNQFWNLLLIQGLTANKVQNDFKVKECLSEISPTAARYYFEEHYNLFSTCSSPDWNACYWAPSLVKAYRMAVSELTHSGHEKSSTQAKNVPRSE